MKKSLALLSVFMLFIATFVYAANVVTSSYKGKVKVSFNSSVMFDGDGEIKVEHIEEGKAKLTIKGEYMGSKINESAVVKTTKKGRKYHFSDNINFMIDKFPIVITVNGVEDKKSLNLNIKSSPPFQVEASFSGEKI